MEMSKQYFSYADDTVSAAETYSEMIADKIRMLEYLSAFDMILLIGLIIEQYFLSKKIAKANKLLKKKAYLDVHTELPNKSRCEELLQNSEFLSESTVCLMFDLNNLKIVNDSLGHAAGDSLISNFARILRNVVLAKDFVGRFGGDEFMVVLTMGLSNGFTVVTGLMDMRFRGITASVRFERLWIRQTILCT